MLLNLPSHLGGLSSDPHFHNFRDRPSPSIHGLAYWPQSKPLHIQWHLQSQPRGHMQMVPELVVRVRMHDDAQRVPVDN